MTETTRPSAVAADEALLSRGEDLLQEFDRAFRMFHELVTGTLLETVTFVQTGKIPEPIKPAGPIEPQSSQRTPRTA